MDVLLAQIGATDIVLGATVVVAAIGTAVLLGLALAVLARRRSRPYLLVFAAFVALLIRSLVAIGSMTGAVSHSAHHLFEHGLDVVFVALVVAAIYYARTVERGVGDS